MKDREPLRLTECELKQLTEATQMWFAKGGGPVDVKIKKVLMSQEDEAPDYVMPPRWNKHKPCEDSKDW